jgi:hypothetical protein
LERASLLTHHVTCLSHYVTKDLCIHNYKTM